MWLLISPIYVFVHMNTGKIILDTIYYFWTVKILHLDTVGLLLDRKREKLSRFARV